MVKRSWRRILSGVMLAGSLAVASPVFAGDGYCATGECTPEGCSSDVCCKHCEKIFEEAGQKLTDQLASMSCCGNCGCEHSSSCCAPTSVCDDGCSDPCGDLLGDSCGEGCGASEEGCKGLFGDVGNGITIGGWTQFGYQNKADGAFTGNGAFNSVNFGPGTNPNSTEWGKFNLNQQALYINKTADGSKGVGFGFRAEMIYGVDGNEAQAFGNPATPGNGSYDFLNGWDHGTYEWALPQLYAEVASGDVSVKLGHFYTPVGYEVIPSGGNFFLSRQLTFYNSEPFTHSGALATYTASDNVQILGGWTAGWDTGFERNNNSSSFLGGAIIKLSDKATFTHMVAAGNFGVRQDGIINSSILAYNWTDKWSSVHQFDVLGTNASTAGANFATKGIADNSIGQINYLFYQVSDKIKLGTRQEWYKADSVSYNTLTYGVNVTPVKNFVVRPEVRHMWAPGANNSAAAPGHENLFNETVVGVDAILTY